MKIFMNNKVYVNQKDFIFLLKSPYCEVSSNIINEAFPYGIFAVDNSKDYDFIVFKSKEAKTFFRSLNYIVNYNLYINKSIEQLHKELEMLMIKKINISINIYETNNYSELYKINHVIDSLHDIIRFKKGLLRIELPEKEKYDRNIKHKVFLKKMMEPIKYN